MPYLRHRRHRAKLACHLNQAPRAFYCASLLTLVSLFACSLIPASLAWGQEAPTEAPADVPTQYLGRVIAPTMGFQHAGWLTRKTRQKEEDTLLAMQQLQIRPGSTVCDLGCGNGYFTLRMARQVGDEGKVLAVDIQKEMLTMLQQRVARAGLKNVTPVLGDIDNPNLPAGEIDLLLMIDVYHEFSYPSEMLKAIRESLSDTGVIALLEFRAEDASVPIRPLHKMSKAQILREYNANGLKLVREFNGLPWQHLMFFARDDSSLPAIEAKPWTASTDD